MISLMAIGTDKILHLVCSILISFVCNSALPPMQANGISFSVGVGKELIDMTEPNNYFSWGDLTTDAIGVGLGSWAGQEMRKNLMDNANVKFAKGVKND